ncbi:hypothetical protein HII17_16340 [Thalassotalea sp. M1531]|uniref:Uncharacterized protein n=1 Tax=Thalassotalea algicola TaxID=2716224 RepID=A0A7Y0LEP4_9GAMM|nr:hypothetical protein [Thalassotalea algicola]NMP33129.1 hypothetical protein [Thalassotalea algicola]
MKLFGSLLTTGLIIGSVWSIALLQIPEANSAPAQSAQEKVTKPVKQTIDSNVKIRSSEFIVQKPKDSSTEISLTNLNITGVGERIALNNIAQLWQTFDDKTLLHARLINQPNKVYVYYRNFGKNYQSADVSIGYLANMVKPSSKATAQIAGKYQQLLAKNTYTTAELATAWQKIDYRQRVHSVVEVHYLDKNSQPISAEVLVKYL